MDNYASHKGTIFNIQHLSFHDGPGIRTTVFVKGCPLRCAWCANPESQAEEVEIMVHDLKCTQCGRCAGACPNGAITIEKGRRIIERSRCRQCGRCAAACLNEAIEVVGKHVSPKEIVEEVAKDILFYQNSGGGVTISGGEPLAQVNFVRDVLEGCKQRGIDTALDTSGYSPWKEFKKVLQFTDLVLFDLKVLNPDKHVQWTGVGLDLILENLKKVAKIGKRLWIRFPFVPKVNDSVPELRKMGKLARELGAERVSILPYHSLGEAKYINTGRVYLLKKIVAPTEKESSEVKKVIEEFGVQCFISS